jgi:hypothetical protein
LNLQSEGWTVWDCSPITDETGTVHVFATRWRSPDRPDATWFLGSQIVRAVADRPEGPYTVEEVVIEGDGGDERWDSSGVINAKIYRTEGRYGLFYTGCTAKRHDTQRIGLLLADSLEGPWERASDGPLVEPEADRSGFDGYLCNNPAFVRGPDGQFRIYYKGRPVVSEKDGHLEGGGMTIGLALSDQLVGPYRKYGDGPVLELDRPIEDPYVWHYGNQYWMLVSELGYVDPGGLLFCSPDGIDWEPCGGGYPGPIGFLNRRQRLEEPNLLFDQVGHPTHLFNLLGACPEDDVYSGFVFEIIGDRQIG